MTIMDIIGILVEERVNFRFSNNYGAQHIYVDGKKSENGLIQTIRISIEGGLLYRRNGKYNIIGFIRIDDLLKEIRDLY